MLCWLYPHSGSYGLSDNSPQLVKQPQTAGNQVIANCLYSLYSLYVYTLFVTCSLTHQCISDDNLDIFGWDNMFCTINGHLYNLDWLIFSSGLFFGLSESKAPVLSRLEVLKAFSSAWDAHIGGVAGHVQGGIRQWIASRESLGRIYRNLGLLPCFIIKDEGFPADIDSIPMEGGISLISIPKSGL